MSLLKDVQRFNPNAAGVLKQAKLCSNVDIQSLTREDLHELFPGCENFKLRRNVYDIIHKQKPVDLLVKELKGFVPAAHFKASLTDNGFLVDYLHMLKDMKTGVNQVQEFLDSHIGLLEEFRKENQESDKGACSSDTSGSGGIQNDQTDDSQGGRGPGISGTSGSMLAQSNKSPFTNVDLGEYPSDAATSKSNKTDDVPQRSRVIYRNVVRGKTLGAHLRLMDKVKNQDMDKVQFDESNEDHQVTVVFCPISSRIGSDVEAAMRDFEDDKPVILVLMFHTTETSLTPTRKTWSCEANVVLHVDVIYHETRNGLLRCDQNDVAVSKIRKQMLEFGTPRFEDAKENAMDLGDNSGAVTPTRKRGGCF